VTFQNQKRILFLAIAFPALLAATPLARSGDDHNQKVKEAAAQSVKAGKVFDEIMHTPDKAIPRDLLAHAEAIAVFPQVIKAAFVFGGEGGRGVVSRRTSAGWSDPVFFPAGGGSAGPQIDASATDIVLLFMNDDAVGSLMKDKLWPFSSMRLLGGIVSTKFVMSGLSRLMYSVTTHERLEAIAKEKGLLASRAN
jgi:lipid-binding SYLF domain-containing protein